MYVSTILANFGEFFDFDFFVFFNRVWRADYEMTRDFWRKWVFWPEMRFEGDFFTDSVIFLSFFLLAFVKFQLSLASTPLGGFFWNFDTINGSMGSTFPVSFIDVTWKLFTQLPVLVFSSLALLLFSNFLIPALASTPPEGFSWNFDTVSASMGSNYPVSFIVVTWKLFTKLRVEGFFFTDSVIFWSFFSLWLCCYFLIFLYLL